MTFSIVVAYIVFVYTSFVLAVGVPWGILNNEEFVYYKVVVIFLFWVASGYYLWG
jgi:hypothetical protein